MCSQDWCVSPALSIQMFHFVVLCSVIAFMTAYPMLQYGHIISDGLIIQSAPATQTFTAFLNTWFSQPVSMFWSLWDRSDLPVTTMTRLLEPQSGSVWSRTPQFLYSREIHVPVKTKWKKWRLTVLQIWEMSMNCWNLLNSNCSCTF